MPDYLINRATYHNGIYTYFVWIALTWFLMACQNNKQDYQQTNQNIPETYLLSELEQMEFQVLPDTSIDETIKIRTVPAGAPETIPSSGPVKVRVIEPRVIEPIKTEVFTPGENGLPSPREYCLPEPTHKMFNEQLSSGDYSVQHGDTIFAPEIYPAMHPEPQLALPMRMNNEASHNIQYLNIEQGLPLPNVRKILQDSRGFFWLGFNGRGLCRYDGRFFVWYTANEGYRGMGVLDMLEDRKGNVWIISEFEIYRYDGKNFYRYYSPISPGANSLTESEDESIWFGNIRGFVKYDGATWTEYGVNEGLPLHNVTSIMEDHSGNIWASGDSGLFIFDGRSITRFFGCGKGMLNNPVFAMVQDKDENIWFGTERGAVKYDGNTFYRYLQRESLTNSKITSIIEDSRGHIWFGSWGDGLIEFDGKSFIHYISTNGMSNYINSLIEDSEHNL